MREEYAKAIANYDHVEVKINHDPDHRLPVHWLSLELEIERWNNIPLPIMHSTEAIVRSFDHTSRAIQFIVKDQKQRMHEIVKKMKKQDNA